MPDAESSLQTSDFRQSSLTPKRMMKQGKTDEWKGGPGVKQARLDISSTLLSAADGSSVDARLQGCMAFDDKVNGRRGQGKGGLAVGGGFAEWEVTVLYKAWDDAGLDCVTAPWSMEERPPSTERERRRREWEFCRPPITDAWLHSVSQNPMGRRQGVATVRIILTQRPRYQPLVPVYFSPFGQCKRFRIQTSGFTWSGLPKGVWGGVWEWGSSFCLSVLGAAEAPTVNKEADRAGEENSIYHPLRPGRSAAIWVQQLQSTSI